MLQGRIHYDLDDEVEIRLALTQYCTRSVFKYCGLKSYLSRRSQHANRAHNIRMTSVAFALDHKSVSGLGWKVMESRSSGLALGYAIL